MIYQRPGFGISGAYLYLEGTIAFTDRGLQAIGRGVVVELRPVSVGGKPGGSLMASTGSGSSIQGEQYFAGDYQMPLPGNRALLIRAQEGGRFQFFVGPKGGQGVQIHPILSENARISLPAPKAAATPARASAKPHS